MVQLSQQVPAPNQPSLAPMVRRWAVAVGTAPGSALAGDVGTVPGSALAGAVGLAPSSALGGCCGFGTHMRREESVALLLKMEPPAERGAKGQAGRLAGSVLRGWAALRPRAALAVRGALSCVRRGTQSRSSELKLISAA